MVKIVLGAFCSILLFPKVAYAYLDPGTGSVLLSTVLAVFGALIYSFKSLYFKLTRQDRSDGFEVSEDTLVVFSEGKSYWGTFRPIINELIRRKIHFRYISMDLYDPALRISSPYMHSRLYSKSNWSFAKLAKIRTPLMLATTPNIGSVDYPMKKSPFIGKLVHMFHAMSGTSNYRLGSLDFYDGVILVGPHQEADLKKIEEIRNIKKKDYVALGLPYLDDMLHHMPSEGPAQKKKDKTTVLIAPSWGNKGCFSEYGVGFVKELAKAEYEIIIRLHPQSHISEAEKVALWKEELSGFHNVAWDQELFAHQAMASSDVLISDTSSIRFDYAFLYLKPVITLDIPKENRDEFESKYFDITWSETSSALIGEVLDKDTIDILSSKVKEILQQNQQEQIEKFRQETVVNFGDSASHIVEYIRTQANEINTKKGSPDA
ncbi:conserved exported hypothetical protein [Candidatus Terasakiella magnetica]|uniref:CDP-glycerol:poly(Glycerophosphate) glycerophosphotransferase n=2 Tax=Candidatus Terasakiella magnetica TaxID=1867952 RepID=A0A1C3RGD9_9PROT|nr:conserved exported hypothetical protein [Candidatus Terasakiella magnetica]